MKKFHFRLQSVLNFQQQRKRQAEMRLLQAQHRLAAAKTYQEGVERQITDASSAVFGRRGQATAADIWMNSCRHVERLGQLLERARSEVERAEQAIRDAHKQLADATSEVEALLFLRNKELDAHRAEVAHRDQIMVDEVVMRRWKQDRNFDAVIETEIEL